jgi:hypothetical protein
MPRNRGHGYGRAAVQRCALEFHHLTPQPHDQRPGWSGRQLIKVGWRRMATARQSPWAMATTCRASHDAKVITSIAAFYAIVICVKSTNQLCTGTNPRTFLDIARGLRSCTMNSHGA